MRIYTDGACSGNPGPGGCAWVYKIDGNIVIGHYGAVHTTNNRMEMMAALLALEDMVKKETVIMEEIVIVSDSQYLVKGMTQWGQGWIQRDFKKVKNVDLWKRLLLNPSYAYVNWEWVRGHNGNEMNEIADRMARSAIRRS